MNRQRKTIGIVDRIAPSGTVFVHEARTGKLGYIANTTPVESRQPLRKGMQLSLSVEDRGDVMVVESARDAP